MKKLIARLEERPVLSFIIVLGLLFGVIALSASLRAPQTEVELPKKSLKQSTIFTAGNDQGRLVVSAQVKKSGVIDIVALAPSVVKTVHVKVGQKVTNGQVLMTLTNDYASGATQLSTEKARLQKDFSEDTYSLEKKIIDLEKKVAKEDDTKTDREEELALKQLKLERERLRLSRSSSQLDLAIAERSDAFLRPRTLSSGTIEHIAVKPGDLISAGTVLATVKSTAGSATLEASLPKSAALYLIDTGIAELIKDGEMVALSQGYVSDAENNLGLVMAMYPVGGDMAAKLSQNSFVPLSLPLVSTNESGFLIPIDAIRSSSDKTSVIVMQPDQSTIEKTVALGETVGTFVVVKSGLDSGDTIVMNNSVLPGETIEPIR